MTTLTWYGHAALGLETGGYKIVVDPFLKENPAASISPDAVEADYILISHGHEDHVGDSIEIAKRTGAMVISNDEIANWFAAKGVEKTHGQHLGGGYHYPFGYLKLTFAIHGSALPDGSNGGNPCGFLLTTTDGKKIYMAQDTGLFGDEVDWRRGARSGSHPDRRQLHHGSRGWSAGGQIPRAESRHSHPLQHL